MRGDFAAVAIPRHRAAHIRPSNRRGVEYH
eukprot:COSAG02_NODE_58923_length_276_cov_0.468927_1_plen_29_part_10